MGQLLDDHQYGPYFCQWRMTMPGFDNQCPRVRLILRGRQGLRVHTCQAGQEAGQEENQQDAGNTTSTKKSSSQSGLVKNVTTLLPSRMTSPAISMIFSKIPTPNYKVIKSVSPVMPIPYPPPRQRPHHRRRNPLRRRRHLRQSRHAPPNFWIRYYTKSSGVKYNLLGSE